MNSRECVIPSLSRYFMLLLICSLSTQSSLAATDTHTYITWLGSEPDKGASAWYIKRRLDTAAQFEFTPPDTVVNDDGKIAFDIPQARFRRTHNAATLEMLLVAYPSADPVINKMGQLMHDIEVNLWRPKSFPESRIIEERLKEIDANDAVEGISLDCYLGFFDKVYGWLQTKDRVVETLLTPTECLNHL